MAAWDALTSCRRKVAVGIGQNAPVPEAAILTIFAPEPFLAGSVCVPSRLGVGMQGVCGRRTELTLLDIPTIRVAGLLVVVALIVATPLAPKGASIDEQPVATIGQASPAAAAAAFMTAVAHSNAKEACSYVDPSRRETCSRSVVNVQVTSFRLGSSAVEGDRAVVTFVADSLCVGGTCQEHDHSSGGLPNGRVGFDHAFREASRGVATGAAACVRRDSGWYVQLT